MVNASLISRLSHAVDRIERRRQQNRPWKVVKVRRGYKEDPDAARARHFAAHPEDRDANVVIWCQSAPKFGSDSLLMQFGRCLAL
jgi:hypothetical protein